MPTCNALILVTPTDGEAFHTGRTLHRVECSAHGLIHPGTTGPDQWSSSHHRTGETWPVDRPAPTPAPALPANRFDCDECGRAVKADEDGCCSSCGRDCAAFIDGRQIDGPTPAPGLDLEAIERAEQAMTPVPWSTSPQTDGPDDVTHDEWPRWVEIDAPAEQCVAQCATAGVADDANAAGIVALRNAAPALIAEVRKLRRG